MPKGSAHSSLYKSYVKHISTGFKIYNLLLRQDERRPILCSIAHPRLGGHPPDIALSHSESLSWKGVPVEHRQDITMI